MVEVKLSKRAQEVLAFCHSSESWNPDWIPGQARNDKKLCLHQTRLAQQLGCSRWTIGRAIKKLKEAGFLTETGRDKQSRCKTYALQAPDSVAGVTESGVRFPIATHTPHPGPLPQGERGLTPWGQTLWERYERTYKIIFTQPDLKERFAQVSWRYESVENESELYSLMFAGLAESYGMPWA